VAALAAAESDEVTIGDVTLSSVLLEILLDEADEDIIGGLYKSHIEDGINTVSYTWDDKGLPHCHPGEDYDGLAEPVARDSVGTGFLMVTRDLLEHMAREYAAPVEWFYCGCHEGMHYGEDHFFCLRARLLGYTVKVHPGVRLRHIKDVNLQ
jgi:hypothetical protein